MDFFTLIALALMGLAIWGLCWLIDTPAKRKAAMEAEKKAYDEALHALVLKEVEKRWQKRLARGAPYNRPLED